MTRKRTMGLLPAAISSLRGFLLGDRSREWTAKRPRSRSLRIEPCESRNLLTAVMGTAFDDVNADGVFNLGDEALANVTVELYKDADQDGALRASVS